MNKRVLVTGGSGLVGSALTNLLINNGFEVYHLSRGPRNKNAPIPQFHWDLNKEVIDEDCIEGVHVIINLAGANVAKNWTPEHKSSILRSRVDGTRLLIDLLHTKKHKLEHFISASAVGYYPSKHHDWLNENSQSGEGFLAKVCQMWESEAHRCKLLNIPTSIVRIGIVLSSQGGALQKMMTPFKLGLGSPLASGHQMMPWIHISDLTHIFQFLIQNSEKAGVYNAVAPGVCSNRHFSKNLAQALNKPFWMPSVPAVVLKLMFGEMAETILSDQKVSSKKIVENGFTFIYPEVEIALNDLLVTSKRK